MSFYEIGKNADDQDIKVLTNNGKKQLLTNIIEHKSIDDIAKEHKCSSGEIMCFIRDIAVDMIKNDGKTIEEVCETLHLTPEDIDDYTFLNLTPEDIEQYLQRKSAKTETKMNYLQLTDGLTMQYFETIQEIVMKKFDIIEKQRKNEVESLQIMIKEIIESSPGQVYQSDINLQFMFRMLYDKMDRNEYMFTKWLVTAITSEKLFNYLQKRAANNSVESFIQSIISEYIISHTDIIPNTVKPKLFCNLDFYDLYAS
jgi:hypothetical protein